MIQITYLDFSSSTITTSISILTDSKCPQRGVEI